MYVVTAGLGVLRDEGAREQGAKKLPMMLPRAFSGVKTAPKLDWMELPSFGRAASSFLASSSLLLSKSLLLSSSLVSLRERSKPRKLELVSRSMSMSDLR